MSYSHVMKRALILLTCVVIIGLPDPATGADVQTISRGERVEIREHLAPDKLTLIDFYADWCGPCKMVSPIVEQLSEEYDGKLNVWKIDTEIEQELSSAFGIQSIPSILFIPKEGQPQMAAGALPKETFKKIIEEELGVA